MFRDQESVCRNVTRKSAQLKFVISLLDCGEEGNFMSFFLFTSDVSKLTDGRFPDAGDFNKNNLI